MPTGSQKTSLKIQSDPGATANPTEYVHVSSMHFLGGTEDCVHYSPSNMNEFDVNQYGVFEDCKFTTISISEFLMSIFGPNNTVRNNVFDATGSNAFFNTCILFSKLIAAAPDPDNCEAYNNTFYMGDTRQDFRGVWFETFAHNGIAKNNLMVVTSTFAGTALVILDNGVSTTLSNNFNRIQNTNNDLVAPSTGDFTLNSGSGMRNGGTSVPVFDDYLGLQRFEGSDYDAGAYEFGASEFVYGPESFNVPVTNIIYNS
jgi:hypothetical protein